MKRLLDKIRIDSSNINIAELNKAIVFSNGFLYNTIALCNQFKRMDETNLFSNHVVLLVDGETYSFFYHNGFLKHPDFILNQFDIPVVLFNLDSLSSLDLLVEFDRINHHDIPFDVIRQHNPKIKIIAYKITNEYSSQNSEFITMRRLNTHLIPNEQFFYKHDYDHIIMIEQHKPDCQLLMETMYGRDKVSFVRLIYDPDIANKIGLNNSYTQPTLTNLNKPDVVNSGLDLDIKHKHIPMFNIGIMESNLFYNKTFLSALLYSDLLNQDKRINKLINQVVLFNCNPLYKSQTFFNIASELSLYREQKIKVVDNYYYFNELVNFYDINLVVSFNQRNDMNYLYFDCYQHAIPLVHNSKTLYNLNNHTEQLYCSDEDPTNIEHVVDFMINYDSRYPQYVQSTPDYIERISATNQENMLALQKILLKLFT